MKPRDELDKLFAIAWSHLIEYRHKTVLLASPEDPDPDSIGCMLAFRNFLRWQGKERGESYKGALFAPEVLRPNKLYEVMRPLGDPNSELKTHLPSTTPSLCVVFDYGSFRRVRLEALESKGTFFIGFDHHKGESAFPTHGFEIRDESAPSTTALLFRFFQYHNFSVDPDTATCLLTGLMTDTGRLQNSLATENPDAYTIAGDLMRLGGRMDEILAAMRSPLPLTKVRAQQSAQNERLIIDETTGLAFLFFSQQDLEGWNASAGDILPLLGRLQHIEEIRVAVAYFELENGEWQASLRTNPTRKVSVREIAREFGGDGHEYVAGFRSKDSPSVVLEKIKIHMSKFL